MRYWERPTEQVGPVVITGLGIEVPGINDLAQLLDGSEANLTDADFNPAEKLGRQGLRYKDRATKLALCAAQSALQDARLPVAAREQLSSESFGVVVSSNLGNLDTVCRVVDVVRNEGADSTSPLDMPNLSSNVIASSLAIRFGCRAINLMVCNGETSGIDALYLAANAIRTRRAKRILVVGVEPLNDVVKKIMETSASSGPSPGTVLRLGDGSAAVVLEDAESAAERGAVVYAEIGSYGYDPSNHLSKTILGANVGRNDLPELWLTPSSSHGRSAAAVNQGLALWKDTPPTCLDLSGLLGETYGALGVFQCIGACLWLRLHASAKAIATSGACWGEGTASIIIRGTDYS